MLAAVLRDCGQVSTGPKLVAAQSVPSPAAGKSAGRA
jgi:hypothetical protein